MTDSFDTIREILEYELDCIAKKGSLDHQSLEEVDKITHSLKSMLAIENMDGGHSERGYYDGGSSGRRRNSMGRFTRDSGPGMSHRYYRDEGGGGMVKHLEAAMAEATDDATREAIQRFLDDMK